MALRGTTVSGGTLGNGNGNAIPAGTDVTINAGATFDIGTLSNFSNGGRLTVSAGSTATLTRFTNTSSGRTIIHGTANISDYVSNGDLRVSPMGAGGFRRWRKGEKRYLFPHDASLHRELRLQ